MIKLPRWPFREDKVFGLLSFAVLTVPLAFTLFGYENYETIKFAVWLILAGVALVIYLLQSPKISGKLPMPLKLALAFFLFWAVLSTFAAVDFQHALFGFYYRFTNSLLFYAAFTALVVLLIKTLTKDKADFLLKVLIFDAFVVAMVAVLQVYGVGYYEGLDQSAFLRAPSLLGNPNFSAMFLAIIIPWIVNAALAAKKAQAKIYYILASLICAAAIILLASRGAILAFVAGGLFWLLGYFWQHGTWKKILKVALPAIIFLAAGVLALFIVRPGSLQSALNLSDGNATLRLDVWRTTWEAGKQHLLLGEGLGSFDIFFEQNHGSELAGAQGEFDDAHNLFLQMYATGGWPLAAGFIVLLLWGVLYSFRNLGGELGNFKRAGLASIVAFIVSASFNPVSIGCFLALAAVLALISFPLRQENALRPAFVLRFPAAGAALLCVLFGLSLILGEQIFAFAYRQYYSGNYQSSSRLVKIAEVIHPFNAMYRIFQIGDEIKLHQNATGITSQIEAFKYQHPLESRSYLIAGKLYYLLYYESGQRDNLKLAIANVKESVAFDPYYVERLGLLAAYEFADGQPSSALLHANWELSVKPDEFASWLLKAKIAQGQNNKQEAVANLDRAFRLHPEIEGLKLLISQAKTEANIKKVPINVYLDESKID